VCTRETLLTFSLTKYKLAFEFCWLFCAHAP
jgi:hypothetical protein